MKFITDLSVLYQTSDLPVELYNYTRTWDIGVPNDGYLGAIEFARMQQFFIFDCEEILAQISEDPELVDIGKKMKVMPFGRFLNGDLLAVQWQTMKIGVVFHVPDVPYWQTEMSYGEFLLKSLHHGDAEFLFNEPGSPGS